MFEELKKLMASKAPIAASEGNGGWSVTQVLQAEEFRSVWAASGGDNQGNDRAI